MYVKPVICCHLFLHYDQTYDQLLIEAFFTINKDDKKLLHFYRNICFHEKKEDFNVDNKFWRQWFHLKGIQLRWMLVPWVKIIVLPPGACCSRTCKLTLSLSLSLFLSVAIEGSISLLENMYAHVYAWYNFCTYRESSRTLHGLHM